jgi:flagellar motor component MotA
LKVETKVIASQHSTANNTLHTWMLLVIENHQKKQIDDLVDSDVETLHVERRHSG